MKTGINKTIIIGGQNHEQKRKRIQRLPVHRYTVANREIENLIIYFKIRYNLKIQEENNYVI